MKAERSEEQVKTSKQEVLDTLQGLSFARSRSILTAMDGTKWGQYIKGISEAIERQDYDAAQSHIDDIWAEAASMYRTLVESNAPMVAKLGNWPMDIEPNSLAEGLPTRDKVGVGGFNAAIACALTLIPLKDQVVSAVLHAAYDEDAIQQVREEAQSSYASSDTIYWLAACSVCREGEVTPREFVMQIAEFQRLAEDYNARRAAARRVYEDMTSMYITDSKEFGKGVAYGTRDGAALGAYIGGHSLAVVYREDYDIYIVSTCKPSLGLDNFQWSSERDEHGRPMSGPVRDGSKQSVQCASLEEAQRAVNMARTAIESAERKKVDHYKGFDAKAYSQKLNAQGIRAIPSDSYGEKLGRWLVGPRYHDLEYVDLDALSVGCPSLNYQPDRVSIQAAMSCCNAIKHARTLLGLESAPKEVISSVIDYLSLLEERKELVEARQRIDLEMDRVDKLVDS